MKKLFLFFLAFLAVLSARDNWSEHRMKIMYQPWDSLHGRRNKFDSVWTKYFNDSVLICDTATIHKLKNDSMFTGWVTCTTGTFRDSLRIIGQLRVPTVNCSLANVRDSVRVLGFLRTPAVYCTTAHVRDSIRTHYVFVDSGAVIDSFMANVREDTIIRTWFTTTSKIYTQAIDSLVTPIWTKNSTGNGDTIFTRMSTGINARVKYIWWPVKP